MSRLRRRGWADGARPHRCQLRAAFARGACGVRASAMDTHPRLTSGCAPCRSPLARAPAALSLGMRMRETAAGAEEKPELLTFASDPSLRMHFSVVTEPRGLSPHACRTFSRARPERPTVKSPRISDSRSDSLLTIQFSVVTESRLPMGVSINALRTHRKWLTPARIRIAGMWCVGASRVQRPEQCARAMGSPGQESQCLTLLSIRTEAALRSKPNYRDKTILLGVG